MKSLKLQNSMLDNSSRTKVYSYLCWNYWLWVEQDNCNCIGLSEENNEILGSFIFNKEYWLCELNEWTIINLKKKELESHYNKFDYSWYNTSIAYPLEQMKIFNKRTSLPDIDNNLMKILKFIERGNHVNFEHSTKSARGLYHGLSKRRSQFIGVLKNGTKCQVLINEGKIKKYIGTYPSEIEAAIVHDFYSIGINGMSAKTNFNYNEEQVVKMIESYFTSSRNFDPSKFTTKLN